MMLKTLLAALILSATLVGSTYAQTIVVEGGTLIDGTGRAPAANATIVIRDGRFASIGRAGEVAIPQGAQVIDARGRYVLPAYLDGHCHWEDFMGEVYLH